MRGPAEGGTASPSAARYSTSRSETGPARSPPHLRAASVGRDRSQRSLRLRRFQGAPRTPPSAARPQGATATAQESCVAMCNNRTQLPHPRGRDRERTRPFRCRKHAICASGGLRPPLRPEVGLCRDQPRLCTTPVSRAALPPVVLLVSDRSRAYRARRCDAPAARGEERARAFRAIRGGGGRVEMFARAGSAHRPVDAESSMVRAAA